jgi:hypothetical protein
MFWNVLPVVILGAATVAVFALAIGSLRWRAAAERMHGDLEAERLPSDRSPFNSGDIADLPAPVRRYLGAVLEDGQPLIEAVIIEHTGTLNLSEDGEQWKPFTSTQRVVCHRPGFDWEARVRMAPGVAVRVHDAYIAGEGILHASLFGLVSLANVRGTPEAAEGELLRFLAESAWYPTRLLPGQDVRWRPVDDTSAEATLSDGETSVAMLFRFGDDGLIESVRTEERPRVVDGETVSTPWEGRFSDYELRSGILIPLEGEVAWVHPDGPRPYWRGRITGVSFEFAETV